MKHDDKREFYDLMGWCECKHCRKQFEDYEEYEEHVCDSNLDMRKHDISWSVQ